LFCLIGLLLRVVPEVGIPSPDVVSYYRWWAAPTDNPALMAAIPLQWRTRHNVPSDPFTYFFTYWYPNTERFNFVDIFYFWSLARLFGDNNNGWILLGTMSASLAIGLLYLVALKLNVPRSLAALLAAILFFAPIGWERGIESELRGVLFLMLALYLALSSGTLLAASLSALSMLVAVFSKETFGSTWILLPAVILYREWDDRSMTFTGRVRSLVRQMLPHVMAALLVVVFVVYIRANLGVAVSYAFGSTGQMMPSFLSFGLVYLFSLLSPVPFFLAGTIIMVVLSVAYAWLFRPADLPRWMREYVSGRYLLVAGAVVTAIVLHAVPYYVTSRMVVDRYLAPANFLAALLIGVTIAPLAKQVIVPALQQWWECIGVSIHSRPGQYLADGLVLVLALGLSAHPAVQMLQVSAQYRIDMAAWQALKDEVAIRMPRNARVVVSDSSITGGESGALLVDALLRGRYDLVFYYGDYPATSCLQFPEICNSRAQFNAMQPPLPADQSGSVVQLRIIRGSGTSVVAPLPASYLEKGLFLVRSPIEFVRAWYYGGKVPYLHYEVEVR